MPGKHMKVRNNSISKQLLSDKNFKINMLELQIKHKDNEIKDCKQQVLEILKQIIDIGEANNYSNSKVAVRKMKEVAEDNYKRIAVELYDLDLPDQKNKIELPTTGKSSK